MLNMYNQLKSYAFIAMLLFPLNIITNSNNLDAKKVVFIIGTGRCGTSCVTGMLKILGLDLGSDHEYDHTIEKHNPKGFFEDQLTNAELNLIYSELWGKGEYWQIASLIDWDIFPQKEEIKNRLKFLLKEKLKTGNIFGIKNPRITMLIPAFIEVATELGYNPKIIVVLRNPDEIVSSTLKLVDVPKEIVYRWISICYTSILENINDYNDVLVVNFNNVLNNPEKLAEKFKVFLPELKLYSEVSEEIESFVDKNLKHH